MIYPIAAFWLILGSLMCANTCAIAESRLTAAMYHVSAEFEMDRPSPKGSAETDGRVDAPTTPNEKISENNKTLWVVSPEPGDHADPDLENGLAACIVKNGRKTATFILPGNNLYRVINPAANESDRISFSSLDRSIVNTSGMFISKGFRVGMPIVIQGSEHNDGEYTISAVSDGKIVTSETLLDESAGRNISISFTIPSWASIEVRGGAILSVASSKVVKINGPLHAGLYQIFDGEGTIELGKNNDDIYPEWFGTVAKVDATVPMRKALAATTKGKTLWLPNSTVTTTTLSVASSAVRIQGRGPLSTLALKPGANDHVLCAIEKNDLTLKDFTIDGTRHGQKYSWDNGICGILLKGCRRCVLENLTVNNVVGGRSDPPFPGYAGIFIEDSEDCIVKNCTTNDSMYTGLTFLGGNGRHQVIGGSYNNSSHDSGVSTTNCPDVTLIGVRAHKSRWGGISINGLRNRLVACTVRSSQATGLQIGHNLPGNDASFSEVIGGEFSDNVNGVSIGGGDIVTQTGIKIIGANMIRNSVSGIYATGACLSTFSLNTIIGGEYGINLPQDTDCQNVIIGNTTLGNSIRDIKGGGPQTSKGTLGEPSRP